MCSGWRRQRSMRNMMGVIGTESTANPAPLLTNRATGVREGGGVPTIRRGDRSNRSTWEGVAVDLGPVDATLVRELQRDGRASFEHLAQRLGMSRVAVRGRVQRLLDSGAVTIVAVVHPAARGLLTLGHLSVDVVSDAEGLATAMAAKAEMPLVSVVAGRHAVIAEVRTTDMASLRRTVTEVRGLPDVQSVTTVVYTRGVKDAYSPGGRSGPTERAVLDPIDRRLVALLQRDGRASYADLGRATNLSASSARARVRALLDAGIVHVAAMIRPGLLGLGSMCGFGLTLDAVPGASDRIAELPEVHYLSETLGPWDAVGTLLCPSPAVAATTLDRIRDLPGVTHLESWMHLRVVKEDYSLGAGGER